MPVGTILYFFSNAFLYLRPFLWLKCQTQDTRKSLVSRLLIFLFGSVTPRFQSNPLQFELEAILNQMARQGYSLVSQQIKAGNKGRSETLLFVFAKSTVNENSLNPLKAPDDINWSELETRYVTD